MCSVVVKLRCLCDEFYEIVVFEFVNVLFSVNEEGDECVNVLLFIR